MAKLVLGEYLKKHGITKRKFAQLLDIEYRYVFRYFRKDYNPTLKTLGEFAKALGCRVRDLIED